MTTWYALVSLAQPKLERALAQLLALGRAAHSDPLLLENLLPECRPQHAPGTYIQIPDPFEAWLGAGLVLVELDLKRHSAQP